MQEQRGGPGPAPRSPVAPLSPPSLTMSGDALAPPPAMDPPYVSSPRTDRSPAMLSTSRKLKSLGYLPQTAVEAQRRAEWEDHVLRRSSLPPVSLTGYTSPFYVVTEGDNAELENESCGDLTALMPDRSETARALQAKQAEEKLRLVGIDLGFPETVQLLFMVSHTNTALATALNKATAAVNRMGFARGSLDWQTRLESSLGSTDALHRLSREFVSAATLYGQLIIRELDRPSYLKSLKPVPLGGVAGGSKFVVGNILYKFALDVELSPGLWMYGGDTADHEGAAKAAGQERKSLDLLLRLISAGELRGLCCPLMTTIDYSGWRLTAQSLLPISASTICYGSADGGRTVAAGEGHPELVAQLERLAATLGLARHRVREGHTGTIKELVLPVDIEVHRSLRDPALYYIIDTARLFPPTRPRADKPRSLWCSLFRPEFVASHGTPLSSDGYSPFGALDSELHNTTLNTATEALYARARAVAPELTPENAASLTRALQQRGINTRLLGVVRAAMDRAQQTALRDAALVEMMARALHKQLRASWRQLNGWGEQTSCVLDLFNALQSPTPAFWATVKAAVAYKFGPEALDPAEDAADVSVVLTKTVAAATVGRLADRAGIIYSHKVLATNDHFTDGDITLLPRVKDVAVRQVAIGEAEALRREAKLKKSGARRSLLLRRASSLLSDQLQADPGSTVLQKRSAHILLHLAKSHAGTDDEAWRTALAAATAQVGGVGGQDGVLLECELARLRFRHELMRGRVPDALAHWTVAQRHYKRLPRQAADPTALLATREYVAKLGRKLFTTDVERCVRSVACSADATAVAARLCECVEALRECGPSLLAHPRDGPKAASVLLRLLPPLVGDVWESLSTLDLAAQLYGVLDDELVARALPVLQQRCGRLTTLVVTGAPMSEAMLTQLVDACAPALRVLHLEALAVTTAPVEHALRQCTALQHLRVHECGRVSLHAVALWPPQLVSVESVECGGAVRPPALPDHVTWRFVSSALAPIANDWCVPLPVGLQELRVDHAVACNDAAVEALFAQLRLRRVSFNAIPATGAGLVRAAQSGHLKTVEEFSARSCLRAVQLPVMEALRMLSLEHSCDVSFELLALHSPLLWRLHLHYLGDGGPRDTQHWLARCPQLRHMTLEFARGLQSDVLDAPPERLTHLALDSYLDVDDAHVERLRECRALQTLLLTRTYLSGPQVEALLDDDGPPLVRLAFPLRALSDLGSVALRLERHPLLRRVSVLSPLTGAVEALPPALAGRFEPAVETVPVDATSALPALQAADWMSPASSQMFGFVVWMNDLFSLHTLVQLVQLRGVKRVVVARCTSRVLQPLKPDYEEVLRRSPLLHWIDVDYRSPASMAALRSFVAATVPYLDVACVTWPLDGQRDEGGYSSFASAASLDAGFWEWRLAFPLVAPMCIASAIFPSLVACPHTPRLALHGSNLASISGNHSSGLANVRAAFAATHAAIRALSRELERGIAVGISVGLWVPGAPEQMTARLPEREVAERFVNTLFAARPEHSGCIVTFNLEVVPP